MLNNNDIIGTIVCAVIDRLQMKDIQFNCLNSINDKLKKHLKLVVIDGTNGKFVNGEDEHIKSLGFGKVNIVRYKQNVSFYKKPISKGYIKKGICVTQTQDVATKYIEGIFTILYEDDVEFAKDSITQLISDFIYLYENNNCLLLSSVILEKKIDKNIVISSRNNKKIRLHELNDDIYEQVNATNTGLAITFTNLFKIYYWKYCVQLHYASPDYAYSAFIRKRLNYNVYITKNIFTKHYGFMKNDEMKTFGKCECNFNNISIDNLINKTQNTKLNLKIPNTNNAHYPVLVSGMGGRTGSTQVQRCISSNENFIIYGEPQGMMSNILQYFHNLFLIRLKGVVDFSTENQKKHNYNGFIPNLSPIQNSNFKAELFRTIEVFYNRYGDMKIQGIKNIDQTPDILTIFYFIYKTPSYIFIERDYEKQYESYLRVKNFWSNENIFDLQKKINDDKKAFIDVFSNYDNMLCLKYDELDNDKLCSILESYFDKPIGYFKRDLLKLRHGRGENK